MTIMSGHQLKLLLLVLAVACAQRRLRLLDTHSLNLSATNELCSNCHRYILNFVGFAGPLPVFVFFYRLLRVSRRENCWREPFCRAENGVRFPYILSAGRIGYIPHGNTCLAEYLHILSLPYQVSHHIWSRNPLRWQGQVHPFHLVHCGNGASPESMHASYDSIQDQARSLYCQSDICSCAACIPGVRFHMRENSYHDHVPQFPHNPLMESLLFPHVPFFPSYVQCGTVDRGCENKNLGTLAIYICICEICIHYRRRHQHIYDLLFLWL